MSGGARRAWAWGRPLGGAGILAVLVWRLGTGPFLDGVRLVSAWSLLAATSITAVTTVCSAWRWQTVARGLGVGLPLGTAIAACYRSQFLNSALPGGVVGDVHRGVRHGVDAGDLGRGLRAVAWERAAGQVVLVALALGALLVLDSPVRAAMGWLVAAAVSGAICAVLLLRALPHRGPSRRARIVRAARADIRAGLLSRRAWPVVTVTSVAVATGHGSIFWVAAWTTGATASAAQMVGLATLVLLAMAVPVNVGGWGPREGIAAWAFAAAGLGAHQGVATATAYGVMGLVATFPGGVVLAVDRIRRSRTARLPLPRGVGHVVADQHVLAGQENRPVDQPDPVGDAVDAERTDRLDARTHDGR
jgi:glycosyltransferase 2 family protein